MTAQEDPELPSLAELEKRLDEQLRSFETVLLAAFLNAEPVVRDDDGRGLALVLRTINGKRGLYARKAQPSKDKDGRVHYQLVSIHELTLRGKATITKHLRTLIREAHAGERRLYEDTENAIERVEAALDHLRGESR